jgi:hypothetical protein
MRIFFGERKGKEALHDFGMLCGMSCLNSEAEATAVKMSPVYAKAVRYNLSKIIIIV